MDLTSTLTHLEQPAVALAHSIMLPGACGPLHLPLEWLPADLRASYLLRQNDLPLTRRVEAGLGVGRTAEVWALLARRVHPLAAEPGLERVLGAWRDAEAARLGVPTSAEVIVIDGAGAHALAGEPARAPADVRDLLMPLEWPRWVGPVLVVVGDQAWDALPAGSERLARSALPVVRLARDPVGREGRAELAAALTRLTLALTAPPNTGWPAWLETGLGGVASAIARGEGPSPRAMQRRREEAGTALIVRLLGEPQPDRALATAVCAPLAHSRRRHLLPNLLDLLRHGAGGIRAIEIAYGLSVERLVSER